MKKCVEFKNNTEMDTKRRSEEMQEFKKDMQKSRDAINKQWGELARKWGPLIEDIFVPSFELMIEKYFNLTIKKLMPRCKVRKNGETLEVDILAIFR